MEKTSRYIVVANRVLPDIPNDRWDFEVYSLTMAGALVKAMRAKPAWFECAVGQLDITVFCMEDR